jgi:uncharacterized membrane protein YbhN (UPF0104 family)
MTGTTTATETGTATGTSRRRRGLVLRGSLIVAAVVTMFWRLLPLVAGAPWSEVAGAVGAVPWVARVLLGALWLGGLGLHTVTLSAALPRLTHRRALVLSLTGSAVANVLPVGGAAGIALNYRMVRSWGFSAPAFATYTVVTNVWDVLVKLCLPAVALGWTLMSGTHLATGLLRTTLGATVVLLLLSVAIVAALFSASFAARVARVLDSGVGLALRLAGSSRDHRPGAVVVRLQSDCSSLVATAWPQLTLGMVAYSASLALLLWSCLHVTGAGLAVPAVVAGFAVERLLTLAGLTPGGAGVVEVGLSGLLLLLGGAPLGVVTGVLLYRLFTFGLEIPVGGLGLVAWLWTHRLPQRATPRGRAPGVAETGQSYPEGRGVASVVDERDVAAEVAGGLSSQPEPWTSGHARVAAAAPGVEDAGAMPAGIALPVSDTQTTRELGGRSST